MNKRFFITGGILGGLAVIMGAFGAHALKMYLTTDVLSSFETGVRYQMFHALLLLVIPSIGLSSRQNTWLYRLFVTGTILFSGSIYILCLSPIFQSDATWLGPITPMGGSILIAGWITMIIYAIQIKLTGD